MPVSPSPSTDNEAPEEIPRVLPRGRHALSREVVDASQRMRLLEAVLAAVAECGYQEATIADITRHAGISRKSFYRHFDNKDECFSAAYRAFIVELDESIGAEATRHRNWRDALRAGVDAFLAYFQDHPDSARVFSVDVLAVSEQILHLRYGGDERFVKIFRGIHDRMHAANPAFTPPSEEVVWLVIAGIAELVRFQIRRSGLERLSEIAPTIYGTMVTMFGYEGFDLEADAIAAGRSN